MRTILLALGAVGLAGAILVGSWKLSRSRTVQIFGELVHRVDTERRVVALTFDDGPTKEGTAKILSILDSLDARATFFVTGSELLASPEQGRAIVQAGHELGNHSFSHRRMVLKSPGWVVRELARTDSLIAAAGQVGEIFFRPPYSKKLLVLPWVLSRTNRVSVTWDVEPESYLGAGKDPRELARHTLEAVRPGSIILLHVMYPSREPSLVAVPEIITGLRAQGFELVTLRELIRG